jgi:FkbM family methyltransferase
MSLIKRVKSSLKKTFAYTFVKNPSAVSRIRMLKLYLLKEYVNTCKVRSTNVKIGVKSILEIFRCETYEVKEPETLDWIDEFKTNEILFDIGGNIGVYSLYAGKKGCKVYTFEPESQNFSRLVNNIRLNGLTEIRPYCMGLGQKNELSLLHLTSMNAGDSQHQVGDATELFDRKFEPIKQGCVVFSLDDLCLKFGLPIPDHIKIDVDGLEPEIIKGSEKVLKSDKVKSVLIEINKELNKQPGEVFDIQQFIESCGYELAVTSKREFRTEKLSARNYIFKKNPLCCN